MKSLVEELREIAVHRALNTPSISKLWHTWKNAMVPFASNFEDADAMLGLGSHLRDMLFSTRQNYNDARGQSSLSTVGTAWEGIVCWYLNLCLVGSRAVAMKFHKKEVPEVLQLAVTVQHGNNITSTESDLVVVVFPNNGKYLADLDDMGQDALLKRMNELTRRDFHELELGIIQCKTNWNDSVQTPMLWNMIYDVKTFRTQQINVGVEGFRISALRNFTYSFVTMPSNKPSYKPNHLPVIRVRTLSGSNYWGMKTKNGIASSLSEIFNRNFSNAFEEPDGTPGDVRTSIQRNLKRLRADCKYLLNPVKV